MPAFPRIKPLPHTLSTYYPIIYVAMPATALLSAAQPQPPHILSEAYSRQHTTLQHIRYPCYKHILQCYPICFHPSFRLSRSIRPVILYCLTLHAFLLLYLTDNSINLLRTGISFHTLQIVGFFLQ